MPEFERLKFFPELPGKNTTESNQEKDTFEEAPISAALEITPMESKTETIQPEKIFQPFDKRMLSHKASFAAKFDSSKIAAYSAPSNPNKMVNTILANKNLPESSSARIGTNSFADHPSLRISKQLQAEFEARERMSIFKSGNIEKIVAFLNEDKNIDPVFEKEITKTEEQLPNADFLSSKDWRILTSIRLFNKETFEHSIGTYLIAREKIGKNIIELGIEIQHEGVLLEQFYRACLFHDIGKMAVPEFIITNKFNNNNWITMFMMLPVSQENIEPETKKELESKSENERQEYMNKNCQDDILTTYLATHRNILPPDDSIRDDIEAMTKYFEKNKIRVVELVPISTILEEDQANILERMGFNTNDSLKSIAAVHEQYSEEMLRKLGFVVEAFLAGNHHSCRHKDPRLGEKPVSITALHINAAIVEAMITILHISDIKHALSGAREYVSKQPMLDLMAAFIDDANEGRIPSKHCTAVCIADELSAISPENKNEIRLANEGFAMIEKFIAQN